jgi:predicted restriction endonuclease
MNANWTRDQLLVAFNLYCKIPFSKTKANNPSVIKVVRLIHRSPASVAMKLGNFGSFDPALQNKGIKGLSGTSRADRAIWDEFNQNWDRLSIESELAAERLSARSERGPERKTQSGTVARSETWSLEDLLSGPTETARLVRVRLHQRFFRESVLASYGTTCCVCSNPVPQLLTASHIIPWAQREDLRANPRNGLCLCCLHHNAFDCGLWTINESYEVLLSSELAAYLPNKILECSFVSFATTRIRMPDKFCPEQNVLTYHRQNLFRR